MKKLLYVLTTLAVLFIIWSCTDLDHSNPFDPDWGDVTALTNMELQIEKLDQIKVIWDSDYLNKEGYTFQIDKKIGDGTWHEKYKLFSKDIYFFTDSIPGINETNYYRVCVGYDENLSESVVDSIFNPFPAPANLNFSKIDISTIKLDWDDNSNGEDSFIIDRSIEGIWSNQFASVEPNILTWSDLNVPINKNIAYRIYGTKNNYHSFKDSTESISNEFPAPTNIVISQTGLTSIQLNWSDNSIGEDGFKIDKKLDDGTWILEYAVLIQNTVTWTDDSVNITDSLKYKLYAFKGNEISNSIFTNSIDLSFPPPSNLSYSKLTISSIKLNWTDNSFVEEGFKIDKKLNNDTWIENYANVTADIGTWTDTNAEINQMITYRVYAFNSIDSTSSVSTPEIDNTIPKPTNLHALANQKEITLTWNDNSVGEQGFKIDRKVGENAWVEDYALVESNIVTWNETVPDTGKYYYKIEAYSNINVSYPSDVLEVWVDGMITFSKLFGSTNTDYGQEVLETNDGGYIIVGSTYSYGAGGTDVWVIKTDSLGNEEWNMTYGDTGNDDGVDILHTDDGGYLVLANSNSYAGIWLIKIDNLGNEIWDKVLGIQTDDAKSFVQTNDGGYLITGAKYQETKDYRDYFLLKTDQNGNQEWFKMYGNEFEDIGFAISLNENQGYFVSGTSYVDGKYNIMLIKVELNGDLIWKKIYRNGGGAYLINTPDDFLLVGDPSYILKIDKDGILIWEKSIGMNSIYGLSITQDGGYIISGRKPINDANVQKRNSDGTLEWSNVYGGDDGGESAVSIKQTKDGGYIFTGSTGSYGSGAVDVWLIKTDRYGTTPYFEK